MGGVVVLERVSFQVEAGEIFGVLGAPGSGKSSLIRILATLIRPDEGEARIFGYDIVRQPLQVQRWINRVSVEASFFKQLSPIENLISGRRGDGTRGDGSRLQAEELLARLGIDAQTAGRPMESLNRNMQQKVSIARALFSRPRLLLLDEPMRGLDGQSRCAVHQLIGELRSAQGTTVLLTSQDFIEGHNEMHNEIHSLCDRVVTLEGGRVSAPFAPDKSDSDALANQNLAVQIPAGIEWIEELQQSSRDGSS
jgi:ABC-2 type transport system ATP-binding protein